MSQINTTDIRAALLREFGYRLPALGRTVDWGAKDQELYNLTHGYLDHRNRAQTAETAVWRQRHRVAMTNRLRRIQDLVNA